MCGCDGRTPSRKPSRGRARCRPDSGTRNEGSDAPRYDHSEIAGLLDLIDAETDGWRTSFESQEIEPVVVTYERLLEATHAEVGRIAAAAGVELPAGIALRPYPGWRRQADELNEEWIRRFRNEAQ